MRLRNLLKKQKQCRSLEKEQVASASTLCFPIPSSGWRKLDGQYSTNYNYSMNEKDYKNLKIALASSAMEGLNITRQTEADCIRLINGEVTVGEMIGEIIARHAV